MKNLKGSFRKVKKIRCLLKRFLYRLNLSLGQWNKQFDSFMINVNYTRCEYDSCIYFKQCNNDLTYLLLYVDNILIAARYKTHIQKLKAQLK